mmetsp:Transcript_1260/g.2682  ORF Transcript_1260/g.2682 Transcript_1260/m.2682 type:complete len:166 (+) Transcript_1260:276-773(+)
MMIKMTSGVQSLYGSLKLQATINSHRILLAHRRNVLSLQKRRSHQQSRRRSRRKKQPPAPATNLCNCDGELCSKHGVEFVACLTECVPVESISLPLVARECVFATRNLEDMTPSDRRFLLYYYYATTIYQFHGKGNRVELPECLKRTVRALHPDEDQTEASNIET